MTTKTNYAKDIVTIASALEGKVEFNSITSSQILPCQHGESINDLLFIDKKFGLYFYTSKHDLDSLCYLRKGSFKTLVVCKDSKVVYEIK